MLVTKRQRHLRRKVAKKRKVFVFTKNNNEKLKDWASAPNRQNKFLFLFNSSD